MSRCGQSGIRMRMNQTRSCARFRRPRQKSGAREQTIARTISPDPARSGENGGGSAADPETPVVPDTPDDTGTPVDPRPSPGPDPSPSPGVPEVPDEGGPGSGPDPREHHGQLGSPGFRRRATSRARRSPELAPLAGARSLAQWSQSKPPEPKHPDPKPPAPHHPDPKPPTVQNIPTQNIRPKRPTQHPDPKPPGPRDHGPKDHGPKDHGPKDHGPKHGPGPG